MCRYTTIFTLVDDFCKIYEDFECHYHLTEKKRRHRKTLLSLSEMMSIVIFFHFSGYKYFKLYYENEICGRLANLFPNSPCYARFIQLMPRLFVPLALMFHLMKGKKTGEYYVDSTHFSVCKNRRIMRHKTFEDLVNSHGLKGKAYADKGYIGKNLFKRLWNNGLQLITGIKRNMKNYLFPWFDKILLRKRFMIETIFATLKEEFNIRPNKHRSPVNFFISVLSALIAYQIKPNKPNINFKNFKIAYP